MPEPARGARSRSAHEGSCRRARVWVGGAGLARLGQLVCWLADPGNGLMDPSLRVMNNVYVYIYI
jgi:hypothetical protein